MSDLFTQVATDAGIYRTAGLLVGWAWLALGLFLRLGPTHRHPWQTSVLFAGVGASLLLMAAPSQAYPAWLGLVGLGTLLVTGVAGAVWVTRTVARVEAARERLSANRARTDGGAPCSFAAVVADEPADATVPMTDDTDTEPALHANVPEAASEHPAADADEDSDETEARDDAN